MSDPTVNSKNITELTAAAALQNTDVFIVGQGSTLLRISTLAELVTFLSGSGTFQPLNANLTAIAGLTTAANKLQLWTGVSTAALIDFTAFSQGLLAGADAAAWRTSLLAAKSGVNADITQLTGLTTPLSVPQGGTGAATLLNHGVLVGQGVGAIAAVAVGTAGQLLLGQGAAADPLFQTMSGDGSISNTGVLTVTGTGGTAFSTLTDHGVVLGRGNNTLGVAAPGTTGQVLIGATGADPAFGTLAAANVSNAPSGSIAATTVQGAIDELALEKVGITGDWVMAGKLAVAAGAAGAPGLQVGVNIGGIWEGASGETVFGSDQAGISTLPTSGVTIVGITTAGAQTVSAVTPRWQQLSTTANNSSAMNARWSTNTANFAIYYIAKINAATVGTFADLGANTILGRYAFAGSTATGIVGPLAGISAQTRTAFGTSQDVALRLDSALAGTISPKFSVEPNGDFCALTATDILIDANRHFRLRSYTFATLPAASTAAGQLIYCSNAGGGGCELVSDGTNWRRTSPGQTTVATNADFTLTWISSAPIIRHTGTLTADRTITLSTTGVSAGATYRITRTGAGAFNLSVGGLKNLATNTWCDVTFDGAAWYLSAYGAL